MRREEKKKSAVGEEKTYVKRELSTDAAAWVIPVRVEFTLMNASGDNPRKWSTRGFYLFD